MTLPPDFVIYDTTDTGGEIAMALLYPGLPSGLSFWLQYWIADASGPAGLTASYGLRADVP